MDILLVWVAIFTFCIFFWVLFLYNPLVAMTGLFIVLFGLVTLVSTMFSELNKFKVDDEEGKD